MHFLTNTLVLALGMTAMTDASPIDNQLQKRAGVYKVERVRNPRFVAKDGPRAYAKALRKYNMPVPDHLAASIARRDLKHMPMTKREPRRKHHPHGNNVGAAAAGAGKGKGAGKGSGAAAQQQPAVANTNGTGLVANVPQNGDVEYLSPVNIGGQIVNLDFDTGSSDLWVFNTQMQAKDTVGHSLFDPTASATFKAMKNAQFEISYGDGSGAAGSVGTDVVNIGGAEVKAQAVELATQVTQSFVDDTATDGLLGLAFSSINTVQPTQQKTFFDNIQANLAEPLFTADLRHNTNGAYEFGAIDTAKFTGAMNFVAVDNSQGFWQVTSDQFAVGNGKVQTSVKGNQAIADTGTTLMIADPATVTAYYAQVKGAQDDQQVGGVTFPCNAALPDLQVSMGNAMATVKGSDINFQPVDAAGTTCFGGLQAGTKGGLQIYGDVFFKSNFVAFNGGNTTLGFATHA